MNKEKNTGSFSSVSRVSSPDSSLSGTCPEDQVPLGQLIAEICSLERTDPDQVHGRVLHLIREAACRLLMLRKSHPRFSESEWAWISEKTPDTISRRDANKFLTGCILEYQAGNLDVWDNAAYFIEEVLGDPETLWSVIASCSREEWESQFYEYNLHRDPLVHSRLWMVANRMTRLYAGDARQIWEGYGNAPQEVLRRLLLLKIPGSTANLVIGALKDEQYLNGVLDIVADVVDSRVIGRVICGIAGSLTAHEAVSLARLAAPRDPWNLDRPLYVLGMSTCSPGPRCRPCPLRNNCVYEVAQRLAFPVGKIVYQTLFEYSIRTEQKTLKRWQSEREE